MQLFFLLMVLWWGVLASPAHAQQCLDYWTVGPSGCNGQQPAPPAAPVVRPTPPAPPVALPPDPMEQKIQEFYDTYDKPPRAFVEFNLNPTPANALKWVQEYESILSRSSASADAWTTAQRWYEDYKKTGQLPPDASAALSREEQAQLKQILSTPAAPVLPAALAAKPAAPAAAPAPVARPIPPTIANRQNVAESLNRGSRKAAPNNPTAVTASRPLLNYYFSAQCQFCKKFGPELASVVAPLAERVDFFCVDMTPGEKTAANKPDYLNCSYRPLNPGEAGMLGVRVTPTLLFDARDGRAPDLIPGYQPAAQLQAYLQQKLGSVTP